MHKHTHNNAETCAQEQNSNYKTNEYSLFIVKCLGNLEKHKRKPFIVLTPKTTTCEVLLQIYPLGAIFHGLQNENAINT